MRRTSVSQRAASGRKKASSSKAAISSKVSRLGVLTLWLLFLLVPIVHSRMAHESFRLPKLLLSECLGLASLALLSWRLTTVERIDWKGFFRQPV